MIGSRLSQWAQRVGLARKLGILLSVGVIISGAATFAALTGAPPFGPDPRSVLVLLLIDLILLLSNDLAETIGIVVFPGAVIVVVPIAVVVKLIIAGVIIDIILVIAHVYRAAVAVVFIVVTDSSAWLTTKRVRAWVGCHHQIPGRGGGRRSARPLLSLCQLCLPSEA